MALGTPTLGSTQGETAMRASFHQRVVMLGDGAYPALGTLAFSDYMATVLGTTPTVLQVSGYGTTAGAVTHLIHYIVATDALQMFNLVDGADATPGDFSSVTLDLVVTYQ